VVFLNREVRRKSIGGHECRSLDQRLELLDCAALLLELGVIFRAMRQRQDDLDA
jgi:hypothetical protein